MTSAVLEATALTASSDSPVPTASVLITGGDYDTQIIALKEPSMTVLDVLNAAVAIIPDLDIEEAKKLSPVIDSQSAHHDTIVPAGATIAFAPRVQNG